MPAEEEVAEVEAVVVALAEAQLWPQATAQPLRETLERAEVVEDEDEAGVVVVVVVVEDAVGETELSRKDRDQQTHNLHHNPVAQASLVVA
jgi:hypothetical protein